MSLSIPSRPLSLSLSISNLLVLCFDLDLCTFVMPLSFRLSAQDPFTGPYGARHIYVCVCCVHAADNTVFSVDRLSIVCAIEHCANGAHKKWHRSRPFIIAADGDFFIFLCSLSLDSSQLSMFWCGGDGRRINCKHNERCCHCVHFTAAPLPLSLLPFLSL